MVQDASDSVADAQAAVAGAAVPIAREAADLAARRQAMRLTVGDVAQRLKLSARQIEALEAGRWADLPGLAFVRGALRGYGRLLETDVAPLLEQVGVQTEPLRASLSLRQPLPRHAVLASGAAGARPSSLGRIVLALALLAALALYFGGTRDLSQVRSWIGVPVSVQGGSASRGQAEPGDSTATDTSGGAASRTEAPSEPIAPPGITASDTTPPPLVPAAPSDNTPAGRRP